MLGKVSKSTELPCVPLADMGMSRTKNGSRGPQRHFGFTFPPVTRFTHTYSKNWLVRKAEKGSLLLCGPPQGEHSFDICIITVKCAKSEGV